MSADGSRPDSAISPRATPSGVMLAAARAELPLLPLQGRSAAVVVGHPPGGRAPLGHALDGAPATGRTPRIKDAAGSLAEALVDGGAFGRERVELVTPHDPQVVLDAVRQAVAVADDVLLLAFTGYVVHTRDGQVLGTPGGDLAMREVAELVRAGRAARPVLIVESDGSGAVDDDFSGVSPRPTFLAGTAGAWPAVDLFVGTLAQVLRAGVRDGPRVLEVGTLARAVEASFHETRYNMQDDWVPGPPGVVLRRGLREPQVALGVNTAFGKRTGFLPDTEAVDAAYL